MSRARLVLFAAGDFAFNLYWQSVSLYLLFFYVEVLRLSPIVAGAVFTIGALWDGVADLIVGAVAERTGASYRRLIAWSAIPLAVAFILMFAGNGHAASWMLAMQLLFRGFYAVANIAYAAWTVRITDRSEVRTVLAGVRMMFGAGAAALVSLGLPVVAGWTAPASAGSHGWGAAIFALAATPLLLLVVTLVPELRGPIPARASADPPLRTRFATLLRNRAFVSLNIAAAAGGAASALLTQSVPYHYRYLAGEPAQGPQMLALMGIAGTAALPAWTLIAARVGARAAWLIAASLTIASLVAFESGGGPFALAGVARGFAGFGLAAWSLLPDSIDWGAARGLPRVEALAFGTFAFVQKATLALAGLAIGAVYGAHGFVAGRMQSADAAAAIRWLMLGVPIALIALCMVATLAQPLRRGTTAAQRREHPDRIREA